MKRAPLGVAANSTGLQTAAASTPYRESTEHGVRATSSHLGTVVKADSHLPAKIQVHRVNKFAGNRQMATVFIDGEAVGSVGNGESQTINISPGKHTVEVTLGAGASPAYEFNLSPDELLVIEFEITTAAFSVDAELRCLQSPPTTSIRRTPSCRKQRSRAHWVLIWGLASFVVGLSGLIAISLGLGELRRIRNGEIDAPRKGVALAGVIIGVVGFGLNATLTLLYFAGVIKLV